MDIFWFIKFVWTFHYYGQFAICFFTNRSRIWVTNFGWQIWHVQEVWTFEFYQSIETLTGLNSLRQKGCQNSTWHFIILLFDPRRTPDRPHLLWIVFSKWSLQVGSPIFHGIQLLGLIVRFFRNSLHFLLKIPNGLVKISAKTPSEVGGEGGNNLDIHHKSALCIHFPPVIIEMCKLISVRFWNFKDGGSLKAIFLAKTQHTQRKRKRKFCRCHGQSYLFAP